MFFVHNRVQDIETVAARLRDLVPEARIAVAHGQMDEGSLEQVVLDFWEGEFDVLVCTTIIESGIDMPTAVNLARRWGRPGPRTFPAGVLVLVSACCWSRLCS